MTHGCLSNHRPIHTPDDIAADMERDRIVEYLDARAKEVDSLIKRLPESAQMDASLFAHRCACLRDEIRGGLHR